MDASKWLLWTSNGSCVGMPPTPTPLSLNSWQFEFPKAENDTTMPNKVGYVLCPHNTAITASSLVGNFQITSSTGTLFIDGKEPFNDYVPASFRFILMKDLSTEFGRWWSNPYGFNLKDINNNGVYSLSVPLSPECWSSVYGKWGTEAVNEFNNVKNYPTYIGLTFGAGGDFGHGCRSKDGTAYFLATDIKLV
jgi:hypothetical protein